MTERVGSILLSAILGVGAFGKVYLGHDTKVGEDFAVKVIDKALINENNLQPYVDREMRMMKMLKHPHIVSLVRVIETPSAYNLVIDLARGGELFDKIVESKHFDEPTARRYFQQMMSAVYYFHKKGIVHRDLKAENLLLDSKGNLKICDFGLARYISDPHEPDHPIVFQSLAGTIDYQAPEVIGTDGYFGTGCDVWSCGVILFFMLCGYLPFTAKTDAATELRIKNGDFNKNAKELPPGAADLLKKILVPDPTQRLTTEGIIAHPWFTQDLDPNLEIDVPPHSPLILSRQLSASPMPQGGIDYAQEVERTVVILRNAFHSCNVAQTGRLSETEVLDVLVKLNGGAGVEKSEVDRFMANFKREPDGSITEDEFIVGWMAHQRELDAKIPINTLVDLFHYEVETRLLHELRTLFSKLDKQGDGIINPADLVAIPQLRFCECDAQQLLDAMASNGRHAITFEDFVRACTKDDVVRRHPLGVRLQRLTDVFNVLDGIGQSRFVSAGFVVAGMRDQIGRKLISSGKTVMSTEFETPKEGSTYYYGRHTDEQGRGLIVGVHLQPAAPGYTKVAAYRASGRTDLFLQWFPLLRRALHEEIVRFAEDTSITGDPELI